MTGCWGAVGHLLALVIAKLIHLSSRGDVKLIFDVDSGQWFLALCILKFSCCQFVAYLTNVICLVYFIISCFLLNHHFHFYNFISLISFQQDSDNTNVSPQSPVSSEVQVCGFVFHSTNISLCSLLSPGFSCRYKAVSFL